jgi:NADH dehydrogenase/NADH:ubiquinone oxidoreductase subunit G
MPERLIKGTIDGLAASAPRGATLLRAARSIGIEIPTLCHHEGLPPDGNCRLCLSEIGGKLAASCMYPLREDGFAAFTNSDKVREARAWVIFLLLMRAPKAPRILKLAEEYGVEPDPRFSFDPDGCLRCGRCVRVCRVQASEAISLAGRGAGRLATGPFRKPPEDCIGCLSCALNCPAGCIAFKDDGVWREVWERRFELLPCPGCGKRAFTKEQLDFWHAEGPLCPECRSRAMARELLRSEFVQGGRPKLTVL